MKMASYHIARGDAAEFVAGAALLLAPICLMYTRTGTEILIGLIDGLFLLHCATRRQFTWLRESWVIAAAAWWGWTVFCSSPLPAVGTGETGGRSLVQALVLGRFFLFSAALSFWLLRDAWLRRALLWMLAATAAWIVIECWQQYLLGADIFGFRRWSDGALTGPFWEPRAGPQLVLVLFPAVLPVTATLLGKHRPASTALGVAVFALSVATMVLIGQRMPALLTGLGLLCCAVIMPRLRPVAIGAGAVAAIVLIATPIVSPPTFNKLVVHFADQMRHFPQSDYGQIYIRATAMGLDNPATGLGYDGFRYHCHDAAYWHGFPDAGLADQGGANGCNIHPHNHYLEALTAGGIPGFALFCALAAAWLATLARGISRAPAIRAGCFIAVMLALWPFASASAFFTLPNAGWFFLILGTGLATAPAARRVGREARKAGGFAPSTPIGVRGPQTP